MVDARKGSDVAMSIRLRFIVGGLLFSVCAAALVGLSFSDQIASLTIVKRVVDVGVDPLMRLQTAKSRTDAMQGRIAGVEKAQSSLTGGLTNEQLKRIRGSVIDEATQRDLLRTVVADLADIREVLAFDSAPRVRDALLALQYPLSRLEAADGQLSQRMALREIESVALGFERAVALQRSELERQGIGVDMAADGLVPRYASVFAAALLSVILAMLGLMMTIDRPLRRISRFAVALTSGTAVAPMEERGPREMRTIIAALRKMQVQRVQLEDLMGREIDLISGRLDREQERLSAALDNMSYSLCMLDEKKCLVLCNEVFTARFGAVAPGTPARAFIPDPRLTLPLKENETATLMIEGPDGAALEVKRRGMAAKGLLITFEDITERQETARQLAHLAGHDALTDLPNRRRFAETLDDHLTKSKRAVVVAVVDIRSFKSINDTYGHPIGDQILKQCGKRLADIGGPQATVGRLGSNEFALIAPSARNAAAVESFAEAVIASFRTPFEIDGRSVLVAVSLGAIFIEAGKRAPGLDADIALQNCDLALYQAKEASGGSTWRSFQPNMRDKWQKRREMQLDLQTALDERQFELYYQPLVDAGRGRVSGFEALIRWHHPVQGIVSPALFIPLAEETGMIEQIGRWALEAAVFQAARWPGDLSVAVNLSAVQFKSPTLVEEVRRAVATSGIAPSRLEIEVTESLFLDEAENVMSALKAFRKMGITISMDDFGTGFSSLGYLSRFPFDKIKIDQSFVRDLARSENIAIVRSIIGLSRALGMKVIAEGVETEEQMQILASEGCRQMQGYFFSKPRPASDLAGLLGEIADLWIGANALQLAPFEESAAAA